jgi:hypothetical protein
MPDAISGMTKLAGTVLEHLGLKSDQLSDLASSTFLQVVMNRSHPDSCIGFPWEFALAEATRRARRANPRYSRAFAVVRHWADLVQSLPRPPQSLIVVESAPGRISEAYEFESERKVVCSSLEMEPRVPLVNPDLNELAAGMVGGADIVHFAGVDGIQGGEILAGDAIPGSSPSNGMFLRGPNGEALISFTDLAKAITAQPVKPILVVFNIYNSVPGAVAVLERGALNAIAFQDEIDDAVAEQFIGAFYAELKRCDWDVAEAFRKAWIRLGNYASRLRGTGIVLW